MDPFPTCICTTVSEKALKVLLETSGTGTYKDSHPWLVALELFDAASEAGQHLPILFATRQPSEFSHWGFVERIDVVELHRATWETACAFTQLKPVNPIWTSLDSVFIMPSEYRLKRERLEEIHQHRYGLTEGEIRPYAICETPAFCSESRVASLNVDD